MNPTGSEEKRLLAYKLWLDAGKPSFRKLVTILAARGIEVSHQTLARYSQSIPEWRAAVIEQVDRPEKTLAALARAKAESTKIEVDHFIGVKAVLLGKLFDSVDDLPINTVDEWTRALDCLNQLDALIHAERGKSVSEKGPGVVSTGLMERLNPSVSLPAFKKPNGTNGANGNGAAS